MNDFENRLIFENAQEILGYDPDVANGEVVGVYPLKRQKTLSNMYGSVKVSYDGDGSILTETRMNN